MKEKLQADLKLAMKEGNEVKRGTVRMLLASVVNKEKEKQGAQLSEEEVLGVIAAEAKKRKEAAQAFEQGGKTDMAEKERKELEILQAYLPEQIGEEEIRKLVVSAVAETGASSAQDMGKVMAVLMPHVKGKADGGLVSHIVKEVLS